MSQKPNDPVRQRSLKPDGKPMRALIALRGSTPENPLTEFDVYRLVQDQLGRLPADWVQEGYHAALATLVKRGYAEQCPRAHAHAQWFITPLGVSLLPGNPVEAHSTTASTALPPTTAG